MPLPGSDKRFMKRPTVGIADLFPCSSRWMAKQRSSPRNRFSRWVYVFGSRGGLKTCQLPPIYPLAGIHLHTPDKADTLCKNPRQTRSQLSWPSTHALSSSRSSFFRVTTRRIS